MPRASGISNISYTGHPGTRSSAIRLSQERYADSRQLMVSRPNISAPYVFLQSFNGGESWSSMAGSQIPVSMISAAENPQISDMRFFHSINGEIVWVYQRRDFVFDPVFAVNYTLYFYFSANNGVTWSSSPVTMARGTANELNTLTMHSDRRFFSQQSWYISFTDTNQTWIISPSGASQISSSLAVTTMTKLEENEFDSNYSSSNFSAIVDKDSSDSNSNRYTNFPLQALQFQNIFETQLPIYAKASAYLENTFAVLGFFNGYRLLESSDADGSSWSGQGDFLNFIYTLNQGDNPLSFHLLPLIEDEINNQKWFLPYIISTGGISGPYSYSIGSIYDNSIPDTENDLRFSNPPRFSSDRAAKSVLMMADNKLYHVQGQNSPNQLPLLKLLTTFTGNNSICEYVGPRLITDNFDRNPSFVDGSLRGWTATPALVFSGGFPKTPLGPLVSYSYDASDSVPSLKVTIPSVQSAPSSASTKLTYEFSRPFWWQAQQNSEYTYTLFGFSIQGSTLGQAGDTLRANVKLITNGISGADFESYNQDFNIEFGSPPSIAQDVLIELPGAIESFAGARLEINVFLTRDTTFRLKDVKLRPTTGIPPNGSASYSSSGTFQWTAPEGVTFVNALALGGGGAGARGASGLFGGGGGGLGWKNYIPVTPGQTYEVRVGDPGGVEGSGGTSYFISPEVVAGFGGGGGGGTGLGGGWVGDGGGRGGNGGGALPGNIDLPRVGGGGGAGGYFGDGGDGGDTGLNGSAGQGGGAGGGAGGDITISAGGGGGVFIEGAGSNGAGGTFGTTSTRAGRGGSGGGGGMGTSLFLGGAGGGAGGGGGMGRSNGGNGGGNGSSGRVRLVWGLNRTFPFDTPQI